MRHSLHLLALLPLLGAQAADIYPYKGYEALWNTQYDGDIWNLEFGTYMKEGSACCAVSVNFAFDCNGLAWMGNCNPGTDLGNRCQWNGPANSNGIVTSVLDSPKPCNQAAVTVDFSDQTCPQITYIGNKTDPAEVTLSCTAGLDVIRSGADGTSLYMRGPSFADGSHCNETSVDPVCPELP